MVVYNEGIRTFLEIVIFNYKNPVMSPAVTHAKYTWLQQPVVSSLQFCASPKLKLIHSVYSNVTACWDSGLWFCLLVFHI